MQGRREVGKCVEEDSLGPKFEGKDAMEMKEKREKLGDGKCVLSVICVSMHIPFNRHCAFYFSL